MKAKLIIITLAMLLLWGCENRTFQYVSTVTKNLKYTVNQEGSFNESYSLYANDFNDDLDLPADAIVRGVYIESFTAAVKELSENEATQVIMSCYAGKNEVLFANNVILPIKLNIVYLPINNKLISSGIQSIRDDLEGFIVDSNPPSIAFRIEGNTYPETGEKIHVEIYINTTITVLYDIETEFIRSG